ncbi:hypothetical protein HQN91_02725 [Rhodococcus fascians]|nr:hypothetical protein [Rhodococcus fascians]MBY4546519.1 hypothetical protein [Rhodococcus fascians]MBY4561468.1 hypothetical protein [Rhodococcus fascians]
MEETDAHWMGPDSDHEHRNDCPPPEHELDGISPRSSWSVSDSAARYGYAGLDGRFCSRGDRSGVRYGGPVRHHTPNCAAASFLTGDDLSEFMIGNWVELIADRLRADGWTEEQAIPRATLFLAQIRGLQLDLLLTNDHVRLDAAFEISLDHLHHGTTSGH